MKKWASKNQTKLNLVILYFANSWIDTLIEQSKKLVYTKSTVNIFDSAGRGKDICFVIRLEWLDFFISQVEERWKSDKENLH